MKRILIALVVIFALACSDNDDEKLEYIESLPIPFLPDNSIAWGMKKEEVHKILTDNGFISEVDTRNYQSYIRQEAIDREDIYSNNPNKWFYEWYTPSTIGGRVWHSEYVGYRERFLFDFTDNKLNTILYYTNYFIFFSELSLPDGIDNLELQDWKYKFNSLTPLIEDKILPIAQKIGNKDDIKKIQEVNKDPLNHGGNALDILSNKDNGKFFREIENLKKSVKWDNINSINNSKITCYTQDNVSSHLLNEAEKLYKKSVTIYPKWKDTSWAGTDSYHWALEFKPTK